MRALAAAARQAGAVLHEPARVTAIELGGARPVVIAEHHRVTAERVVIAAGPWSGALLQSIGIDLPLAPSVAQVTFLDAPDQVDRPGVAEWETSASGGVYGHSVPGIGYKIAFDAGSTGWDPDVTDWKFDAGEESRILDWLKTRVAGMPPRAKFSQRHPWTMTPDADFIVDNKGPVTLACGCSGHAFKFGPALGRLVADVMDGVVRPAELRLDRTALARQASATAPIVR
jgi:sarcosine oxidase